MPADPAPRPSAPAPPSAAHHFVGYLLRLAAARFAAQAARAGTTARDVVVLGALAHGDVRCQQALAARLGIHPTAMVPLVARLERTGLLTRVRDPADRRTYRLSITAAGRAAAAVLPAVLDRAEERCTPQLSPDERRALRAALARLLAATGPPVAGGTAYLVACAHRRLRRRGDALLAGVGVRIRQGGPLVVLADLGRCDQRTLARALAVTEPAAAQVVDELVRAGLVRRGRDPRDRRRWVLTLTVGGRQRAARARAAAAQVEREVAAVLGDVDAAALRALLLRVCVPSR